MSCPSTTEDPDEDSLTTTIHWLRDGFQVDALNNLTTVSTDWLGVGQSWSVRVILNDGFAQSPPFTSDAVVINNIMPVADFTFTENPLIEAITILDASASTDSDGEIVAWFWDIGGESFVGETVSVVLVNPMTSAELTVMDADGGSHVSSQTITASFGPVASDLDASVSNGDVNLNWEWAGDATTFTIWRTHEPIVHSSGLLEIESVGQTNSTSWSEPLHLVGTYHYTVTADVGEVHNPRISSNTVTVALEVSQMPIVEPEGESSLGTTMTSLLAFLLIFGAIATALLDRFSGGVRKCDAHYSLAACFCLFCVSPHYRQTLEEMGMLIEIHLAVALVMVTLGYLSLHLQSYHFLKIEIQPMLEAPSRLVSQ